MSLGVDRGKEDVSSVRYALQSSRKLSIWNKDPVLRREVETLAGKLSRVKGRPFLLFRCRVCSP